jgi:transposase
MVRAVVMTEREEQLSRLLAQSREALSQLQQENAFLRQKIDALVRRVFGSSSEVVDAAQLQLFLQGQAETVAPAAPSAPAPVVQTSKPARSENKPRLPEHLPVVEEVIDPDAVKAQPEAWRYIGQEVSEQLDYEPGRFLRRRLIRRKYVHKVDLDRPPVLAPLPLCLQERALVTPGLLAHVLISKYCDHLPLYRQADIYTRRHGVPLPRQTLARWVELAADWLRPIYEQIRTGVLGGGYVQVDETPIEYLEPGHGQTRQGYFWTCSRPGGDVVFRWETSRAAACLNHVIPVGFTECKQCKCQSSLFALLSPKGQSQGSKRTIDRFRFFPALVKRCVDGVASAHWQQTAARLGLGSRHDQARICVTRSHAVSSASWLFP